jgi:hypothetical protein
MDRRTLFAITAVVAGIVGMSPRLVGQTVSLGIIGGGSLTDAVQDVTRREPNSVGGRVWSQSKDWMAGAMIELRFRPAFSVEVDGMYRTLHMTWASVLSDGTLNSVSPSPVVTWEFPVLAKYRFNWEGVKPFVEAGPSFRTTGNLNFNPSHLGASAGLGVEARWRGLNVAPRLRYTRWAPDLGAYGSSGTSQLNQVELLVAFSHEAESRWRPGGGRISLGAVAGWGLNADLPPSTSPFVFEYQGVTMTQHNTGVTSSIVGPSVEIHLRRRLSVEIDALHKSLRTRGDMSFDNGAKPQSRTWTAAATWQFPVLAKYRVQWGKVGPFAEAGPSFRLPQWNLSTHGVTAGAGIEMRLRALKISPALRFTHWGSESGPFSSGVARNEASVLVGLSLGGGLR